MSDTSSTTYHNTVFWFCNDVVPMRHFYTDLIGLEETYFKSDNEAGWLSYQSSSLAVVFIRAEETLPVQAEWTKQPSYNDGKLVLPSWVIQVDYADFDAVVARLNAAEDVPCLETTPREPQQGHKAFWVRDPMGVTIEIYASKGEA